MHSNVIRELQNNLLITKLSILLLHSNCNCWGYVACCMAPGHRTWICLYNDYSACLKDFQYLYNIHHAIPYCDMRISCSTICLLVQGGWKHQQENIGRATAMWWIVLSQWWGYSLYFVCICPIICTTNTVKLCTWHHFIYPCKVQYGIVNSHILLCYSNSRAGRNLNITFEH